MKKEPGTKMQDRPLILIGCEESQRVCIAFRELGYEAYSCDLEKCTGTHPEWHLQMDLFDAISLKRWDAGIFFPPCTYLTVTANSHFKNNPDRWQKRLDAVRFVHRIMNCYIEHIAIENPKGVLSSHIRKPDQYIHPYYFGDPEPKSTGLWLKNLPLLRPTQMVEPEYVLYHHGKNKSGFSRYGKITGTKSSTNNPEQARIRSMTFPGIARAMAQQWGPVLDGLAPDLLTAPFGAQQNQCLNFASELGKQLPLDLT